MSSLETEVAPSLKPLIDGVGSLDSLRRAERLAIARWSTKTACILDAGNLEPRVPKEHLLFLHDHMKRIPPKVAVFARFHEPSKKWFYVESAWWKHVSLDDASQQAIAETSYKIALQFGHLILLVAYWPLDGWNFSIEKDLLVPIWPATLQPKRYVHPAPMTSNTSEDQCLRFSVSVSVYPTYKAKGRT